MEQSKCELFIGLPDIPETFYVEFKHCPLGFTLQESTKSCYCDPVLTNNDVVHIESCNLSDETILRLAHSWISANKDNIYIINTTYVAVHLIIVFLINQILIYPTLTHNVNSAELVYCVVNVNKVLAVCLVHISVYCYRLTATTAVHD